MTIHIDRRRLIAGAAASLVGATLFSVGQLRETQRQRDAAIEARTRADMQVEFQKVLMSEVGDGTLTLRGLLAKGRAVLEQQYGGDPRTTASLLEQLATSYNLVGYYGFLARDQARTFAKITAQKEKDRIAALNGNNGFLLKDGQMQKTGNAKGFAIDVGWGLDCDRP